jgi:ATP/maltotriose-dependent transcriptional regulator MalT
VLNGLADLLYLFQDDLVTARSLNEEALTLFRELGSKQVVQPLWLAAEIAISQGDVSSANQIAKEALALNREMGNKDGIAHSLSVLARVEARMGDYDTARHCYDEILPLAREIDHKPSIAFYLEQLAEVVAAQGDLILSARLWGTAESLRTEFASPLPSPYRSGYERAIAASRTRMGEQAFDAAWDQGRSMPLEQVLDARGAATISTQTSAEPSSPPTQKSSSIYPDGLTTREVEVLKLVAQGLSNAEIAEQLIISLLTVKAHMRSLYNKLGISSRSAATRYAIEHHLV